VRQLSASTLLSLWERAAGHHPIDRALLVLCEVYPERSFEELAGLPVGRRDALLLRFYRSCFGSQLDGIGQCPKCGSHAEFGLRISDLIAQAGCEVEECVEQSYSCTGYDLRFRLPSSLDLAAIVECRDVEDARKLLLRRCVLGVVSKGSTVEVEDLPEGVIEPLTAEMLDLDPLAELQLDLSCPSCDEGWQMILDVVCFLWERIEAEAKRLLREVHVLARAYAWSESDILQMSARRRRLYSEMVT
jgi:hypothetical protein